MIVIAEQEDRSLADELKSKLQGSEWTQWIGETTPSEQVSNALKLAASTPTLFAIGSTVERLALPVTWLRSLGSQPIVAVTYESVPAKLTRLLRVGATEVIDLGSSLELQMECVEENLRQHAFQEEEFKTKLSALTPAQRQVASLLANSLSELEISVKLGLSYYTIHNHVKKIYRQYAVHSRVELMQVFQRRLPSNPATVSYEG
jgi:DNA-binding CsgD family transcriptional regulator